MADPWQMIPTNILDQDQWQLDMDEWKYSQRQRLSETWAELQKRLARRQLEDFAQSQQKLYSDEQLADMQSLQKQPFGKYEGLTTPEYVAQRQQERATEWEQLPEDQRQWWEGVTKAPIVGGMAKPYGMQAYEAEQEKRKAEEAANTPEARAWQETIAQRYLNPVTGQVELPQQKPVPGSAVSRGAELAEKGLEAYQQNVAVPFAEMTREYQEGSPARAQAEGATQPFDIGAMQRAAARRSAEQPATKSAGGEAAYSLVADPLNLYGAAQIGAKVGIAPATRGVLKAGAQAITARKIAMLEKLIEKATGTGESWIAEEARASIVQLRGQKSVAELVQDLGAAQKMGKKGEGSVKQITEQLAQQEESANNWLAQNYDQVAAAIKANPEAAKLVPRLSEKMLGSEPWANPQELVSLARALGLETKEISQFMTTFKGTPLYMGPLQVALMAARGLGKNEELADMLGPSRTDLGIREGVQIASDRAEHVPDMFAEGTQVSPASTAHAADVLGGGADLRAPYEAAGLPVEKPPEVSRVQSLGAGLKDALAGERGSIGFGGESGWRMPSVPVGVDSEKAGIPRPGTDISSIPPKQRFKYDVYEADDLQRIISGNRPEMQQAFHDWGGWDDRSDLFAVRIKSELVSPRGKLLPGSLSSLEVWTKNGWKPTSEVDRGMILYQGAHRAGETPVVSKGGAYGPGTYLSTSSDEAANYATSRARAKTDPGQKLTAEEAIHAVKELKKIVPDAELKPWELKGELRMDAESSVINALRDSGMTVDTSQGDLTPEVTGILDSAFPTRIVQGQNIRPIYIPEGMRFLDVNSQIGSDEISHFANAVGLDPSEFKPGVSKGEYLFDAAKDIVATRIDESGRFSKWKEVGEQFSRRHYEIESQAQRLLSSAGYDGIKFRDNNYVIFPDSLHKVRNAITGDEGGFIGFSKTGRKAASEWGATGTGSLMLGGQALGGVGGALSGTVLGAATAGPDATEEERLGAAGIGALGGLAGGMALGTSAGTYAGKRVLPKGVRAGKTARLGERGFVGFNAEQKTAPRWYSSLQRAVNDIITKTHFPARDLLGSLKNPKYGVKPDEMKWTGFDDFLKERAEAGKLVDKQEALDFLRQNEIRVDELVKSNRGDWRGGETLEYTDYPVLKGGKNYRELILTLPISAEQESKLNALYEEQDYLNQQIGRMTGDFYSMTAKDPDEQAALDLLVRERDNLQSQADQLRPFAAQHFQDDKNILGHVRFDEYESPNLKRPDGKPQRILVLKEVQSDWQQAGRDSGFVGQRSADETRLAAINNEIEKLNQAPVTPKITAQIDNLGAEAIRLKKRLGDNTYNVPQAPFVGSAEKTAELIFKRMVRWAAENDFDQIAWTTGTQQAKQWADKDRLVADTLAWRKSGNNVYVEPIHAGQSQQGFTVPIRGQIDVEGKTISLDERLGKSIAEQIRQSPDNSGVIQGVDEGLTIGAEGFKAYYDVMLPKMIAEKFGKKWGVGVGETNIATEAGKESTLHSVPITPAMKKSAIEEGFPVMQVAPPIAGAMGGAKAEDEGDSDTLGTVAKIGGGALAAGAAMLGGRAAVRALSSGVRMPSLIVPVTAKPAPGKKVPWFRSSADIEKEIDTQQGWLSRMGKASLVTQLPGAKGLAKTIDPWVAQETHLERVPLVFRNLDDTQRNILRSVMSNLEGIPQKDYKIKNNRFSEGVTIHPGAVSTAPSPPPGLGPALSDVLEHEDRYIMPDSLRKFIKTAYEIYDELEANLAREGINIKKIDFKGDGHYFGRIVREVHDVATRKTTPEARRAYDTMEAGLKAGVKYEDDILQTAELGFGWLLRKGVAGRMHDLIEPLSKTQDELVDPITLTTAHDAKMEQNVAEKFQLIVNSMKRGGSPYYKRPIGAPATPGGTPTIANVILSSITQMDKYLPGVKAEAIDVHRLKGVMEDARLKYAAAKTTPGKSRAKTSLDDATNDYNLALKALSDKANDAVRIANTKAVRSASSLADARAGIQDLKVVPKQRFDPTAPAGKYTGIERVRQPWATGRFFPEDVAEFLEKEFKRTSHPIISAAEIGSDTLRALKTGFDLGTINIQLLPLMAYKPKAWGKAAWYMLKGATKPDLVAQYMAKSDVQDILQTLIPHGLTIEGIEYTKAIESGGAVYGAVSGVPVIGPRTAKEIGSRAEAVFSGPINIGKIEVARAFLPAIRKLPADQQDAQLTALAGFLNNLTGTRSSLASGLGATQRGIESSVLFFSPRMTRSSLALVGDALQGGFRDPKGRTPFNEAQKALAGLMAANAILAGGLYTALNDRLPPPDFFNPQSPDFMTVRVFDNRVGLGGPHRALAVLVGNMLRTSQEDPEAWKDVFNRQRHPLTRWWTGRSSPVLGVVWDAAQGEDFTGDPIFTNPSTARDWAMRTISPMWASDISHPAGEKGPTPAGIAASFVGLRSLGNTPAMERDMIRERIVRERGFQDRKTGERITSYRDLDSAQKHQVDESPEVASAIKNAIDVYSRRGDAYNEYKLIRDQRYGEISAQIGENTKLLEAGKLSGNEYRQRVSESEAEMAHVSRDLQKVPKYGEAVKKILGKMQPSEKTLDQFLDAYYDIADKAYDKKTGQTDVESLIREREELKAKFPKNIVDAAMKDVRRFKAKEYNDALDQYAEYMKIPKYYGLTVEQGKEADRIAAAISYSQSLSRQTGKYISPSTVLKNIYGDDGVEEAIRIYRMIQNQSQGTLERLKYRRSHPLIEKYFGRMPTGTAPVDYAVGGAR